MVQQRPTLGYDSTLVEAPAHPRNRELLSYWERRRTPGGPILRARFEPLDVPRLLPGIFMAEPIGGDYRFRLAGTDVEARLRRRVSGATLMEIYGPEFGPRSIELYDRVSRSIEPVVTRGHYCGDCFDHVEFEVLHLPIRFDSGALGVLGGQFAFP